MNKPTLNTCVTCHVLYGSRDRDTDFPLVQTNAVKYKLIDIGVREASQAALCTGSESNVTFRHVHRALNCCLIVPVLWLRSRVAMVTQLALF